MFPEAYKPLNAMLLQKKKEQHLLIRQQFWGGTLPHDEMTGLLISIVLAQLQNYTLILKRKPDQNKMI